MRKTFRVFVRTPARRRELRVLFLRRLGELILHRFLERQQFLRAWPRLDALEMRHAVLERRQIELELGGAADAPEEVDVRRREVIEEERAAGQQIVGDAKIFE